MQKYNIDGLVSGGTINLIPSDNGMVMLTSDVEQLQADHTKEVENLKSQISLWRSAEERVSAAYLRIRQLVGAWDTKEGGVDRFEVTEEEIRKLVAFWEWSRLADKVQFGFEYKTTRQIK